MNQPSFSNTKTWDISLQKAFIQDIIRSISSIISNEKHMQNHEKIYEVWKSCVIKYKCPSHKIAYDIVNKIVSYSSGVNNNNVKSILNVVLNALTNTIGVINTTPFSGSDSSSSIVNSVTHSLSANDTQMSPSNMVSSNRIPPASNSRVASKSNSMPQSTKKSYLSNSDQIKQMLAMRHNDKLQRSANNTNQHDHSSSAESEIENHDDESDSKLETSDDSNSDVDDDLDNDDDDQDQEDFQFDSDINPKWRKKLLKVIYGNSRSKDWKQSVRSILCADDNFNLKRGKSESFSSYSQKVNEQVTLLKEYDLKATARKSNTHYNTVIEKAKTETQNYNHLLKLQKQDLAPPKQWQVKKCLKRLRDSMHLSALAMMDLDEDVDIYHVAINKNDAQKSIVIARPNRMKWFNENILSSLYEMSSNENDVFAKSTPVSNKHTKPSQKYSKKYKVNKQSL